MIFVKNALRIFLWEGPLFLLSVRNILPIKSHKKHDDANPSVLQFQTNLYLHCFWGLYIKFLLQVSV